MWVSQALLDLFQIGRSTVDSLREESATLRAVNLVLERELSSSKIMSDWLRHKVNQLEIERSRLMEVAYPGLSLPVPEIARSAQQNAKAAFDLHALFTDEEELHPQKFS